MQQDLQDIIRAVAQEVIKRLQEETTTKPCVMVLGPRNEGHRLHIKECSDADMEILFWEEDTAGRTPVRYVLPFLSCNDMADLASGKASEEVASEVLQLLLSGVEVEVLEYEYRAYSESAPGPLYALYEAYEKTLVSYGMTELARKAPEAIRFRETLVTQSTVQEVHNIGATTLLVPLKANITPLAAEAAKNLNLTILKRL